MFGKNPIRHPETTDGSTLQVVNIFLTLQGEGPFVGHPAVFVRLGGCNLACNFCDTEFEEFSGMRVEDILNEVVERASSPLEGELPERVARRVCNLVVITGGEPLRQNITPLCEALLAADFTVQIETNGTLWRPLPEAVHIVCSPKVSGGMYHPIRPDLLARVDALKFIISAHQPEYADVGDVGQSVYRTPIYVQPMDEYDDAKNAANRDRAAALAQRHGYRFCLQLHKALGLE